MTMLDSQKEKMGKADLSSLSLNSLIRYLFPVLLSWFLELRETQWRAKGRQERSNLIAVVVNWNYTSVSVAVVQNALSVSVSVSFSLSLSYFCGFFRDPYLRSDAPDAKPEAGSQMIFEEELLEETSKGLREAGWDRRRMAKILFRWNFSLHLILWRIRSVHFDTDGLRPWCERAELLNLCNFQSLAMDSLQIGGRHKLPGITGHGGSCHYPEPSG